MDNQKNQIIDSINSRLISLIGNDSDLYSGLNSAQRNAIAQIYLIHNCYTDILNNAIAINSPQKKTQNAPAALPEKKYPYIPRLCTGFLTLGGTALGNLLFKTLLATGFGTLLGFAAGEALSCFLLKKPQGKQTGSPKASREDDERDVALVSLNEKELEKSLKELKGCVEALMNQVEELSKPKAKGHDITTDVSFAEWVQKIVSVIQYVEDRQFRILVRGELLSKLMSMGISVQEEFGVSEDGEVIMPIPNMFVVKKLGKNPKPELTLPAVCHGDRVLAKGEIVF
jgi:hypothetical protein